MARDYVAFFQLLLRFADIIKDPDGLVQGFLAKETEDPAWDTYSIRGGKLYCQREEVFREARQEVTEIPRSKTKRCRFPWLSMRGISGFLI